MGDIINNSEILRKLGFDNSNQWIFYDERFNKFFNFFAENITNINILTEEEVLEKDNLIEENKFLEPAERCQRIEQLDRDYPGLRTTEQQVSALIKDVALIEDAEKSYAELVEDMRASKNEINMQLNQLETDINRLINLDKQILEACQNKSKTLENLQRENVKLCSEAKKCFTKIQSPPLFMHQLSLDQYFLKCDSFMQYFTLYMKEKFKIQEFISLINDKDEVKGLAVKLENLENSIVHYTLAIVKEKAKAAATQSLIDQLDLTQMHVITLADMERETHELELINEHHLRNAYETLINDLTIHVQQRSQQQMELILYENTKLKLERALKRREDDKQLTKIISDALCNAELIWMATQLDLEKKRNRFDNTEQLNSYAKSCSARIKSMHYIQSMPTESNTCNILMEKLAEQLSLHLVQKVRTEPKAFLYEYEKFCRLFNYELNGLLNKKPYTATLELLNQFKSLEEVLNPFVYDSPVASPMLEHVQLLRPIFNAKITQQRIDNTLRDLRTDFQVNVSEKMANDKFLRYQHQLWIWFLREPKRVVLAIEEVKKAADMERAIPGIKVGGAYSMSGIKTLGGIKRM